MGGVWHTSLAMPRNLFSSDHTITVISEYPSGIALAVFVRLASCFEPGVLQDRKQG
jgi:hypothetical protein